MMVSVQSTFYKKLRVPLLAPAVQIFVLFFGRLFYRCLNSKLNGKKWCGSVPWQV